MNPFERASLISQTVISNSFVASELVIFTQYGARSRTKKAKAITTTN